MHALARSGVLESTPLVLTLLLGGLVSAGLVSLSVLAFSRRRSRSYLLITLALGAFAVKAFLGGVWMLQLMPSSQHHFLEHSMDLLTVALLVAAVYYGRTVPGDNRPNAEEAR